ncbi:Glo1, partial [Symbiodinium natans]
AQFLKETYDVSFDGGEARHHLWKKVLPQNGKRRGDAKVQEWLQAEHQAAEERAEKRWRQKFEEWQMEWQAEQANFQPDSELGKERSASSPEIRSEMQESTLEDLRSRAEAAEKECEELRSECKGQLDELARLYEEFRRAHKKVQEEKARRETIEKHLSSAVEEQDKWTAKLDHRISQLHQARQQRRAIGAGVARFSNRIHTLDLRAAEWLAQAASDKSREIPDLVEELTAARAAASEAERQVADAEAASKEALGFLESLEVSNIDLVDGTSFASAYKAAWEPWALEALEEDTGQSSPGGEMSAEMEESAKLGSESQPQSPFEESPESPDSASYPSGKVGELEVCFADEDVSAPVDPGSPEDAKLEGSYTMDDALEEDPSEQEPE